MLGNCGEPRPKAPGRWTGQRLVSYLFPVKVDGVARDFLALAVKAG